MFLGRTSWFLNSGGSSKEILFAYYDINRFENEWYVWDRGYGLKVLDMVGVAGINGIRCGGYGALFKMMGVDTREGG